MAYENCTTALNGGRTLYPTQYGLVLVHVLSVRLIISGYGGAGVLDTVLKNCRTVYGDRTGHEI